MIMNRKLVLSLRLIFSFLEQEHHRRYNIKCVHGKKMCSCLRCFSLGNLFKFALFASSICFVFSFFFLFSFGSIFRKCKCDMSFFLSFYFILYALCRHILCVKIPKKKKQTTKHLGSRLAAAPKKKKIRCRISIEKKNKILWVCYYMEIVSASDDAFDDNVV